MKHFPFVDYKLQDGQEPLNRQDEVDSDDEIDSVSKI